MKKWEEERKKKQYASKINNVKSTLKTQPKGSKSKTPTMYSYGTEQYGEYPARGHAENYDTDMTSPQFQNPFSQDDIEHA